MKRKVWRHHTRVYKDGPLWRWKCKLCGHAAPGMWFGDSTQQRAFGIAWVHTALGGYDYVE